MSTARVIEKPAAPPPETPDVQSYNFGNELRCSKCFENEAGLVCAQCGRLLCTDCAVVPGFFHVASSTVSLPLQSRQHEDFVFCSEHKRSYLSAGALVFLVSLLATVVCLFAGSWLVLPSAAVSTLAFVKKRFVDRVVASRRRVKRGVFGAFARYQFSTNENLALDFDLGSRTYAKSNPASGKLTVSVKFDHGDKRAFVDMGGSVAFPSMHAGFYRLREVRTLLLSRQDQPQFATKIAGEIPSNFLDIIPAHSIGASAEYEIAEQQPDDEPARRKLPFNVTPNEQLSAVNSRVWGLTFKTNQRSTTKMMLKRLIVRVPVELESVQSTDGVFESEQSRVVWQDIPFNSEYPASVQVEFSQPIRKVPEITAQYAVEINGSGLSGLNIPANCVWYPNGRQVEPERVTVTQSATISGVIKAATRLQANRQEIIAKRSLSRPGCFLTIELAHELIAGLSKRGLYAKDIFEAPSGIIVIDSLQTTSRYWEIVGRCYRDHQPYDVHIVLAGQEQRAQVRPVNDVRLDLEVVVRSLSELQFTPMESQKVDSVALDLLSAADEILGALS